MKAILMIEEAPKKCDDCPLSYRDLESCYCEILDEEVKYWKKSNNCPLIEINDNIAKLIEVAR